ncbi:MAG: ABC transporter permease [Rubrivivax sp.]
MTAWLRMAAASAWARRGTLVWVIVAIAIATALLLAIERLRHDVRASFLQAVSGTDLIVGARTGPVQLLLYSVFRVGGASNEVRLEALDEALQHRAVAWWVPLALGDSHRGYPVLGTTTGYFEHFRYGDRQPLALAQGRPFAGTLDGLYEATIGADVAARLGYAPGQKIVLAHGLPGQGSGPMAEHADKPFTVVGVLARTGTPVDRTVHVSLEAITAIHLDWMGGAPVPGFAIPAEAARKFDLAPKTVTAALVGLKSRSAVFMVQRQVQAYEGEPLMAVLPGVALDELWQAIAIVEQALLAVSALVALAGIAGLVAVVQAGLAERRRELAVLRAIGAGRRVMLGLLAAEGLWIASAGVAAGVLLALLAQTAAGPWLHANYGIALVGAAPWSGQALLLLAVWVAAMLAAVAPGWRACRMALADGLAPRA